MLTFLVLAFVASSLGQDYVAQYQQEFSAAVVPPFRQSVSTYQTSILQHIAGLTADAINKDPSAVAKDLNCNTHKLSTSLKVCVTAADQLKGKLDSTVVQLTTRASQLQTQVTNLNTEQAKNQAQLASLNSQVAAANVQVQQAQNGLNAAQATLNDEQHKYDKAREGCIGKRSVEKRGFHLGHIIKKITHPITKPLEKAICHVFNHGGIDRAQGGRDRAQQNLNNARSRLTTLQSSVATLNQHVAQVNADISKVTGELGQVNAQLSQVTAQRNAVNVVDTQVKSAESKVSTFLGKAEVLQDVVNKMVDFNALLVPLNAIGQQLGAFKQQVLPINVAPATIAQVTTNLKLLQTKLPTFPFVENVPGC